MKEFLLHSTCYLRNGNLWNSCVSEIHKIKQGVGACRTHDILMFWTCKLVLLTWIRPNLESFVSQLFSLANVFAFENGNFWLVWKERIKKNFFCFLVQQIKCLKSISFCSKETSKAKLFKITIYLRTSFQKQTVDFRLQNLPLILHSITL